MVHRHRNAIGREVVFWKELRQLPADHHRDEPVAVELVDGIPAGDSAITQHRDLVGDSEHLVDSVRDIDDGAPARFQIGDDAEQPGHLPLRQRGRGLVHDEDVRLVRDGARDFDHLSVGDRQFGDALIRLDVDMHSTQKIGRAPGQCAMVDQAKPRQRLAADPDVFRNRHRRHQIEFLVNHRHAAAKRHTAGIGPVET